MLKGRERFGLGVSTLERIGKQRGWGRKPDQHSSHRATPVNQANTGRQSTKGYKASSVR